MAFTQLYDQYAPILSGGETEEERRRRLEEEAAAATPVTQTLKTNPVTGEQEMTIKGTPEALSPSNPLTPTVTGPAIPEQAAAPAVAPAPVAAPETVAPPTIEELRQQYQMGQLPQAGEGVQVAGPAVPGAMRIPPAQQAQRDQQGRMPILQNELANATARLETATDPAEQQRLQGDIAALQREIGSTRGGMQRVAAPVNPAAPAPVATAPAAPVMTPEQVQRETQMRDFQAASKNPDTMIEYMARKDIPDDLKTAMKLNHYETLVAEDRKTKAEQRVINTITNNPQSLPKIINDKTEEGSLAKAFLYSLIGFKSGADAEVAKMNLPGEWKPGMNADGDTGTILYSTNGKPLQGVKTDGTKMSPEELIAYASQGATKTTDISLTQHQAIVDGELHTFSSKRTPSGIMYKDDSVPDGKWTRQAPAGMTTLGKVDRVDIMAAQAGKQVMDKMRAENVKAISQKAPAPHSEAAILKAGSAAREAVMGGKTPVGQAPAAVAPAMPAATTAARPVAPLAQTAAPAMPAGPVRPSNLSPEVEAEAQAIYSGQKAPITGQGAQNYRGRAVMDRVNEIAAQSGEPYDASKFKIVQKTRQDFITGQQGKAVQSMNVAVDHLDTLQQAANALKNSDVPLFNKFANAYARNTGQEAPNSFNAVKSIVGSEVAKAVAGGATALGDREEIRKEINDAGSPEQLAGVIDKYQRLMAGQVKGLKQTYESGTGMKDFENKLLPRTKEVLSRIEASETGQVQLSPAEKARQELEKRRKGQQ